LHDDERRNVSLADRSRGDKCALSDATALGDAAKPSERYVVLDDGVPRDLDAVREHTVGADLSVVPNVRTHHDEVMVPDVGGTPLRASMNGRVLSKDVAGSSDDPSWATSICLTLRLSADDSERMHDAVGS